MKLRYKLSVALAALVVHQFAFADLVTYLDCKTGSGDVSRPLFIKNTTEHSIAKGTLIHWDITSITTGQQELNEELPTGGTTRLLGPAGSGGECKAWYNNYQSVPKPLQQKPVIK